ncbi:MAG: hypothetical protein ACE5E2_02690 [Candidatus Binatia bacterium]
MTIEEVHKVIHTYWSMKTLEDSNGRVETEVYVFDPLETLYGWVSYENERLIPTANFDRTIGLDGKIQFYSAVAGVVLLLASLIPFQKFGRRTGTQGT